MARFAETRDLGLLDRASALGWRRRFHRVNYSDRGFDVLAAPRYHADELLISLPHPVAGEAGGTGALERRAELR